MLAAIVEIERFDQRVGYGRHHYKHSSYEIITNILTSAIQHKFLC